LQVLLMNLFTYVYVCMFATLFAIFCNGAHRLFTKASSILYQPQHDTLFL
jgi:hypothetical protein